MSHEAADPFRDALESAAELVDTEALAESRTNDPLVGLLQYEFVTGGDVAGALETTVQNVLETSSAILEILDYPPAAHDYPSLLIKFEAAGIPPHLADAGLDYLMADKQVDAINGWYFKVPPGPNRFYDGYRDQDA